LYFVQQIVYGYRDKRVVGVFVRFRPPLLAEQLMWIPARIRKR
jgi:hypothetical protein